MSYICPVCKNKDSRYIGYINDLPYCRKCISFIGKSASDSLTISNDIKLDIKYSLTVEQERIAKEVLDNFINSYDQLIYAVCGAGKTELVFKVIDYALKHKMKVGFAIPRKDVVIELSRRFQASFKNSIVTPVYGGNNSLIEGDIICLTTHQLYRYENFFDLLILDEIDAFPYKDNDVLYEMFKRSVKGHYVLMSATPSEKIINEFKKSKDKKILTLFTRYHMKEIPVPKIKIFIGMISKLIYIVYKLNKFIKENKPTLIFVPTIYDSKNLYNLIKNLAKTGYFVNSKSEERKEIIDKFRNGEFKYLVTTAVLERGVTLKNLQVIIYKADSEIYDDASLVQISGRVGRVVGATSGEVIYLSDKKTKAMVKAIEITNEANRYLQKLL